MNSDIHVLVNLLFMDAVIQQPVISPVRWAGNIRPEDPYSNYFELDWLLSFAKSSQSEMLSY
jgi:hypothetical protein